MTISVNNFSCSFTVETKFGSRLEFVLTEARERNKGTGPKKWFYSSGVANSELVDSEYYEILWDMFKKELDKTGLASVDDCCVYGDISYTLRSNSIEDLYLSLNICKQIVNKWIKIYNIDKMKDQ